jgi:hypothetical protein
MSALLIFFGSGGTGAAIELQPPIANPDEYTVTLGAPPLELEPPPFVNDNLRGEDISDMEFVLDTVGLEGSIEVGFGQSITYTPPAAGGGARDTVFRYHLVGIGGASNQTTVTIHLEEPVTPFNAILDMDGGIILDMDGNPVLDMG